MASGPIFVTADEPLLVFESLDRAVHSLEWQDVEDGLYRGYDSDGRLITFGSEPIPKRRWSPFHDKRTIANIEPHPTHGDDLRLTLAQALAMPETTDFEQLKNAAVERFGLT